VNNFSAMGRVIWPRQMLGILLVNGLTQSAFLFAAQFLSLYSHPGRIVVLRDLNASSDLFHNGAAAEISGVIRPYGGGTRVSLLFGVTHERDREEHYDFPVDDLKKHHGSLQLMYQQNDEFELQKIATRFFD